jgi:type I restriction enzyme, S subunit
MKAGWEVRKLMEVCEIKPPKSEAKKRLQGAEMVSFAPMETLGIGRKYLETNQERRLDEVSGSYTYFAEGDVLLAKITPCFENGKLGIARNLKNGIGFGSSEYVVLRPNPSIHPEWLYHLLDQESFRTEGAAHMSGAVGHKRVSKEFIETFPVPIPPLSEQAHIVGILDEAFASIATAKANTQKNLENAKAVFESHLNSVFSQRGEGWVEKKVSEIAMHSLGKMLDKAKNKGTMQPYLRNLNVRWFKFDLSDLLEMPFLETETSKYTAIKGDVLVCEGGYPARSAIWDSDEPIHFQKALHRVRFHEPFVNRWFVYYLYAKDLTGELKEYFSGTGIQHFTGESLAKFPLPIPPSSEIQKSVELFDSLFLEIQTLENLQAQKLSALDELKKSLLHQAFTGKL